MTDVLVIGGGLAGWRAAEAAAKAGASVALVANGAGNSPDIHALNVPVGPGDSVELFIEDTLRSGRGHCERALVEVLCRGALALADEFPWDRRPDGSLDMLQPVGCSVPRCVSIGHHIGALALAGIRNALAGGDISKKCPQSGRFLETLLPEKSACFTEIRGRVTALRRTGTGFEASVNFVETPLTAATARRTSQSGRDAPAARPLRARSVVLATGGWCGKYEFSDNPPELRGDGIALAQSLGAAVRDMDAVQYEPTVALAPAAVRRIPVITTMLHEGATFRNARGE
ncbi:MAG: FAD-binding protein [Kiritimatiellae bacterium]|nr:FAD-binding protein [Kiritimatiellia bacterium]